MKALTILQPWAEMIARGVKPVENRSWPTSYRGPLAIHTGKSHTWLESENALEWPSVYGVALPQVGELTFGAIVAIAELVDCVRPDKLPPELAGNPWACGPFCWILANVRRLDTPFPCKGMQSLWETDLVE